MDRDADSHLPPTETRPRFKRKPRRCPACGQRPVGTILYGYPMMTEELQAELREGRTVIGGCTGCPPQDPTWECSRYGWQAWKELPPPWGSIMPTDEGQ